MFQVLIYNHKMKVFLSVDIEGATGISSFSQCGKPSNEHYDFAFARRMLTHDVNAAIRGARRAGATEIVVKDAHATCKNLLVDELEPGTQLISGIGAGKDGMMDGIDSSFGSVMLIGYHAMGGALHAFMDHALIGGLQTFLINGEPCGEIAVSAAIAGAYGVPTTLVTSDLAGCLETQARLPSTFTYSTKDAHGRYQGNLKHPEETRQGIERASERATAGSKAVEPFLFHGETTMEATFRTAEEAELPSLMEGVERRDAYTLWWSRSSFLAAHKVALNVFNLSVRGRQSGN